MTPALLDTSHHRELTLATATEDHGW